MHFGMTHLKGSSGYVREGRVEMCNIMVATTAGTVGKKIQKGIF